MENEEYETIDLLEVLNAVRQHLLAVILTTLILACAGFGVSKFLMTPKYQASALMIVNTRQDTTSNVTSDQINSATKLVSTYSIIIKSDTVLQQVINNLGLSLTYPELAGRVTVSAVDDTQVMKVTVLSDNPEWARQVCEQITVVSPDVILGICRGRLGQGHFQRLDQPRSRLPQHDAQYRSGRRGRSGHQPRHHLPHRPAGQQDQHRGGCHKVSGSHRCRCHP